MKVEPMVSPRVVSARLLSLIAECESLCWASAWLRTNAVFTAVRKVPQKIERMVIGTHRYITGVDCLRACKALPNVRVIAPKGALFHPKLYAFKLRKQVVVYVGSSNLTDGGLRTNIECGVFLSAEKGDLELQPFFDFINTTWNGRTALTLTPKFIKDYEAIKTISDDNTRSLPAFPSPGPKSTRKTAIADGIDPLQMSWARFVDLVRNDTAHGMEDRLLVLDAAQSLFERGVPFSGLTPFERKCLAGLIKPSKYDGIDWGFFGQMSAFGSYVPVMAQRYRLFSNALACIPLAGEVSQTAYDNYLRLFKTVPGASKTWTGMGTRLLAMKRPDQFVCIDNSNREALCKNFGAAPSTTHLDNYWNRIITPMRRTPWWQAPKPTDAEEAAIWSGRAALLDALYYDPSL